MDKGFETLRVYRLSEDLSDSIWTIVAKWKPLDRDTVGKQLIRAADSVGANIAEGYGRGTFQDHCRFVDIARGSLYESRHWLRRAFRRSLLDQSQIDHLQSLLANLLPQLNAYRNSLKRRSSKAKRSPPNPNT